MRLDPPAPAVEWKPVVPVFIRRRNVAPLVRILRIAIVAELLAAVFVFFGALRRSGLAGASRR